MCNVVITVFNSLVSTSCREQCDGVSLHVVCHETINGTSERGAEAVSIFSNGDDSVHSEGSDVRGAGHSLIWDTEESKEGGGGSGGDCEGG